MIHNPRYHIRKSLRRLSETVCGFFIIGVVLILSALAPRPH